jgi:hypothetical protein
MDLSPDSCLPLHRIFRGPAGFLDASARETGALVRERKITDASMLLSMLLAHVCSDYSFKDTAALFGGNGAPSLCASSLHARFVRAEAWLGRLLSYALTGDAGEPPAGCRWLRATDASVINGPRSQGTDWRIHVLADPHSGRICAVRVEPASVGESAALHPLTGDIASLLDRGYSNAPNVRALAESGGSFAVRVAPHSIRICDGGKRRMALARLAQRIPAGEVFETGVLIPLRPRGKARPDWHLTKGIMFVDARLVGSRLPSGEVMWLLADAGSTAPAGELLALYRFRWQIELLFKRLKSLAGIGRLKSTKGPCARAWILAKLLMAALAQRLVRPASPEGCAKPDRHSAWSRLRVACDAIRRIVLGDRVLGLALSEERMRRLMNSPRKRGLKLAPASIRVR